MLHLLLGSAGSGKTTRLTESILADLQAGVFAYLIIPEQQANLSERTVLPRLPAGNRLLFTLAGFSRLAQLAQTRFGGGVARPLTEGLRTLLLWRTLRDAEGLLSEYRSVSPRSDIHLTSLLLSTLEELHESDITPTRLERAAAKLPADSALAGKLYDLALLDAVFRAELEKMQETGGIDPLVRLAGLLEKQNLFAGARVYVDSFTSFTAEEYAVLSHILRQAAEVTVALPTDAPLSRNPAFAGVNETVRRLRRLAGEAGVPTEIVQLSENRRTTAPELTLLTRSLWDLSIRKEQRTALPPDERGAVTLLRCTNSYAEAEAIALHILDLVHRGYRYGEIAVVVRDTSLWRGVLDAALARRGVPYYFSEKTALTEEPLSRLILSSLSAVAHGFPRADVLTLVKTGLCPVSTADADLFEQYVFAWEITGADFTADEWRRNPDGYTATVLTERGGTILAAANRVRETVMTPLLRLHTAVGEGGTLPALCRALYEYLEEMGIAARCADRAEAELAAGYPKEAGETLRIYDTVVSLLVQCAACFPDMSLEAEEFATVLRLLFSKEEIASVPSLHDSVTVGSAATLRVENIAVSFVAGLCEGEFPRAVAETGLLSEAERRQMTDLGLAFDRDGDRESGDELLYVWRAMSKPSRLLYLSTQRAGTDGSAKAPSIAWNRVLFLLPYLEEQIHDFDLRLLPIPPPAAPAPEPEPTPMPTDGLYTPRPPSPTDLPPTLAAGLFGDTLWLTQARIRTFVGCPYSFYCQYVLSLREKTPLRMDAADSGTFFHYVLEQFIRSGMDADGGFTLPTEEAIEPLSDAIVRRYLNETGISAFSDMETLHRLTRLKTLSVFVLRDVRRELAHSRFAPAALELDIGGSAPDAPPPYEVALAENRRLLLAGRIDRVDRYRRDGTDYLLAMDYKSGSKTFDRESVLRGTDLQLPLYLFALCSQRNAQSAGALYLSLESEKGKPAVRRSGMLLNDREILSARNDELDAAYLAGIQIGKSGEAKGDALTDGAAFAELENNLRETLRRIGEDIFCGRAGRTPGADVCRYCPFLPSCPDAVRA